MNKIISLLALFFIIGVSCNRSLKLGTYKNSNSGILLLLKNDSTYSYSQGYMHLKLNSTGTWDDNNRKFLFLNSYFQSKLFINSISELKESKNRIVIKMDIKNENKNAVYGCFLNLNGKILMDSTKNGFSSSFAVSSHVDSVSVYIIKTELNSNRTFKILHTPTYRPKDKLNTIFIDFTLDDRLFDQVVFENEVLKVRGKKIIMLNKQTGKNITLKLSKEKEQRIGYMKKN